MERLLLSYVTPEAYDALPLALNQSRIGGLCLSQEAPHAVKGYQVPRVDPLCYPGERPAYPFVVHGETLLPARAVDALEGALFAVNTGEGVINLNQLLDQAGVVCMEDRVPLIGFGSNGSPGQLAHKFSPQSNKSGFITNPGDHIVIPTFRGTVRDIAAAYSSRLGTHGYFFAEAIRAIGATTHVAVNFLSPDQLKQMVATESAYELSELGSLQIDGLSSRIPAYGFAGKNEIMLDKQGRPILLEAVHTSGVDAQSMTQEQVLQMLADDCGGRFDALYPNAPFFARSPSNISAFMTYRTEFLRRKNKNKTMYLHPSGEGEPEQQLISEAFRAILRLDGRIATSKLLDELPPEHRQVTPETFGKLYAAA